MTSDGIPCTDNPPKKMWLTPPSSPHRIRSSLHNPTPHHSSSALASEESRSGCNLSVTKEPLAQRYSTGDIGTARDPSSAFYESLTGKESETVVAPKKESSDSIAGSAESLVAKVSLCIANHIGTSKMDLSWRWYHMGWVVTVLVACVATSLKTVYQNRTLTYHPNRLAEMVCFARCLPM